jgi:hypothetical protein
MDSGDGGDAPPPPLTTTTSPPSLVTRPPSHTSHLIVRIPPSSETARRRQRYIIASPHRPAKEFSPVSPFFWYLLYVLYSLSFETNRLRERCMTFDFVHVLRKSTNHGHHTTDMTFFFSWYIISYIFL